MEIELSGMRKIIAERMSESWHLVPRVTYTTSVDMTNAMNYMKSCNEGLEDKSKKVTINHILMKLCADLMKEFPYVNASVDEKKITLHEDANIALAVAVEQGLLVPNIKGVQKKNLSEVAEECNNLVTRTRKNKITMDDITGGTFTITNLGMMGIESFTPIVNQPEVAILGVNKIVQTPVACDGVIIIKPLMNLNLVADHRVIDGAYAAKYLSRLKECLETL